jgi:hypothetical protein
MQELRVLDAERLRHLARFRNVDALAPLSAHYRCDADASLVGQLALRQPLLAPPMPQVGHFDAAQHFVWHVAIPF